MQPATGWTEKWIKTGFKDLGPDLGGSRLPQFILVWCRRREEGALRGGQVVFPSAGGSWRSPGVIESTSAGLDLATFSLNPPLSRVSTLLLNLLRFAGLHHILVIIWTWDWLLWFHYTLTERNPLIFLYSCLAGFLAICLA